MEPTAVERYRSQYRDRQMRAKAQEVRAYHQSPDAPGKPLHLVIPGGLAAVASLVLIAWTLWAGLFEASLNPDLMTVFLVLLVPVYIGSVYAFAYGYELYDVPRAIRLTAIVVFFTFAFVLIIVVLLALLKEGDVNFDFGKDGGGSSSGGGGGWFGGASTANVPSNPDFPQTGGLSELAGGFAHGLGNVAGSSVSNMPPIVLNLGPTVTNEIVKEVPVEAPAPEPISCPFCGRSYIPIETKFACPNCGASTPPELLAPGEGPEPS